MKVRNGYATLMSPNKGETAAHGCRCPVDMTVRICEGPVKPWVVVRVPLALSVS